jgi:hypothetical protein
MKRLLFAGLLVALLMPLTATAQNDFEGTWKVNLDKTVPQAETEIFLLQNGIYQCRTCVPTVKVKTDGADQTVTGNPYYDTISIKVVDDRSIERTEKKSGKTVATSKMVASADGNTLTVDFSDSGNTGADPVTGKLVMNRVAKSKRPPNGAHAISGSWRVSKMEDFSENALTFTFKVDGDALIMSNQTGQSYTAKLDGTEAPYKGDPGINAVSVRRLSNGTFVETDKHDGKAIKDKRIMVSPGDKKTMHFIVVDDLRGTSILFVADKQ